MGRSAWLDADEEAQSAFRRLVTVAIAVAAALLLWWYSDKLDELFNGIEEEHG